MVSQVERTIENLQIRVDYLQFQLQSFQTIGPASYQDHRTYHRSQLTSELAANSCRCAGDQSRATGEITGAHSDQVSRNSDEFKEFKKRSQEPESRSREGSSGRDRGSHLFLQFPVALTLKGMTRHPEPP